MREAPITWLPSFFLGSKPSPKSDAYSFGVMAYELLAGRRPFRGETLEELRNAHLLLPPPPTALPPRLDKALRRLLAKKARGAARPEGFPGGAEKPPRHQNRGAPSQAQAQKLSLLEEIMEPIWYPEQEEIRTSRLFRFMEALGFQDYEAFYRYSVEEAEDFYGQFFTHLGIPWRRPYERVISGGFPLPHFFPGGRLNLVEAALRHDSNALALIHETEEGGVRTLTYGELLQEVERVAAGLQALGVERGDRVGLWFPMGLEAAVLLLAVSWIGAIAIPIFSGYAAEAAAVRLKDARAKLLAVQDGFLRRGRRVELLYEARKAQALAETETLLVVRRLGLSLETGEADYETLRERPFPRRRWRAWTPSCSSTPREPPAAPRAPCTTMRASP